MRPPDTKNVNDDAGDYDTSVNGTPIFRNIRFFSKNLVILPDSNEEPSILRRNCGVGGSALKLTNTLR